jgi:hypothetical protein
VVAAHRPVRGVVRDKATGSPLAGVRVSAQPTGPATVTDQRGRYELLVRFTQPGLSLAAHPPTGQPYFAAMVRALEAAGSGPLAADFALIRGTPLRGRVTDRATGRPPKRATVEYYPLFSNGHRSALTVHSPMVPASSAPVGADGSYCLAVLPGPGLVLVAASPRDSYATARLGDKELTALRREEADCGASSWAHIADRPARSPARCVDRYNALSLIDPDGGATALTLDFALRRARPLRGTVVGPDGRPLAGVKVCGLTSMPDAELLESASFTVEGLCPRLARQLSFFHKEKNLGQVLTLRGDESEALTVRLEPCGAVVGRLLDCAGRPVPGETVWAVREEHGLDFRAETDAEGRFRVALVPGLKCCLRLASPRGPPKGLADLAVRPGQVYDLGDVRLAD